MLRIPLCHGTLPGSLCCRFAFTRQLTLPVRLHPAAYAAGSPSPGSLRCRFARAGRGHPAAYAAGSSGLGGSAYIWRAVAGSSVLWRSSLRRRNQEATRSVPSISWGRGGSFDDERGE